MTQMEDIRQSENWAKYLSFLGWKSARTSTNINIEFRSMFFGSVVKVQKPKILTKKDLEEIENICKSKKALFIKVEPSLGQDEKILENYGYIKSYAPLSPPSTIFISLKKSEAELWKAVTRSGKRFIRKAQREKTKVSFYPNPNKQKIQAFHKLLKETAKKKGFCAPNAMDLFHKANIFKDKAIIIEAENKACGLTGAYFCLVHKNAAWFMHGATTEVGRKTHAGYELMWQTILYFNKRGFNALDLEGKDDDRFPNFTKTWGGFSYFKEKFGGEVIKYPHPYIKYLNPTLKKLTQIAQLGI